MLHQPAKSFKPAPAGADLPSPAAVFDPVHFIKRARELGMIIFPSIFTDGTRTYGLTTPEQKGFSSRNLSISEEFAASWKVTPDSTSQIFDALCADLGVDPDAHDFNAQVNEICSREDLRRQGDRKLIGACRRAEKIAAEDARLEERLSEMGDSFMKVRQSIERPVAEGVCMFLTGTAQEMRAELKCQRAKTSPAAAAKMTIYIKAVATWEVRVRLAQDHHGFTAAKRECRAANLKTNRAIEAITDTPATTPAGVAAKCRVMKAVLKAGYGHHDIFEALATSIYDDGAQLAGDRLPRGTPTPPALH